MKVYKLAKLLWLHIENKAREMGIYKSKENIVSQVNNLTSSSIYNDQEKLPQEPIEMTSNNYQTYIKLGICYRDEEGKYDKAEEMLKKAIEINPRNDNAYLEL